MVEQSMTLSIHGHTRESDGAGDPSILVAKAAEAVLDFFGVSDHESVAAVPSIYDAVDRYNQAHGTSIQAVAAFEVNIGKPGDQGDIVFAKPGPLDPAFLAWGQGVIDRRRETTPEEAITEGVLVHGAIALLVHPELWLSQSFSLARIEQMVGNLSPQVVKHVVLEVGNWAGNIFLFFNTKREERVEALAYKLGLARLASTDFHAAWMIPMWSTQYKAIEATPQSFYQAIENRQTEPGEPVALSLVLYARLAYALFRASLRAYILNPIKRSLDTGNQAQEIGSVLPY